MYFSCCIQLILVFEMENIINSIKWDIFPSLRISFSCIRLHLSARDMNAMPSVCCNYEIYDMYYYDAVIQLHMGDYSQLIFDARWTRGTVS